MPETRPNPGLLVGWTLMSAVVGAMFVHTAFFLKR